MDCPLNDSQLQVHYKGMLLNDENSVFYDTRVNNNGQPWEFSSGEGLVSLHFSPWDLLSAKIILDFCAITIFVFY